MSELAECKAPELLELAAQFLARRYPNSLIVRELSIGNWGSALIDLVAICDDEIIGIEIKGDGDSPTRLGLQQALYSKAADRMWILPSPDLENRCFEGKHKVTREWGRLVLRDGKIEPFKYSWGAESKPGKLAIAPAQLLEALWKAELQFIAAGERCNSHSRMKVDELVDEISELVPLRNIRKAVCGRLLERDWAEKRNDAISMNEHMKKLGYKGEHKVPEVRAWWAKDLLDG